MKMGFGKQTKIGQNPNVIKEKIIMDNAIMENAIGEEKKDYNLTQWSKVNDDIIITASNTFDTLDSGYYRIGTSPEIGLYFKKIDVKLNKLYKLPNEASNIILNDISKFWESKEQYEKYGRVFRRNYLIYSAPGTGKTSLINLMCQELIEKYNGIVLFLSADYEIGLFSEGMERLRMIEPNRKIIIIIEDIDNYLGKGCDGLLLNILDGNLKFENAVTIATTNYIDKVAPRFKNRPSRFDRVIEFPLPNYESRKMFIEKTVFPDDLKKINIEKWANETKDFTIDHINELILLYFVFGHTEEESFNTIKNMVKNNDYLDNVSSISKKSSIGFDTDPRIDSPDLCYAKAKSY